MIDKNVEGMIFEEKAAFYDKWIGSLDHQIWLMNCGYKFGYTDCCIFEFVNDAIIRNITGIYGPTKLRNRKMISYEDSPPNQYWVPCWEHYYTLS